MKKKTDFFDPLKRMSKKCFFDSKKLFFVRISVGSIYMTYFSKSVSGFVQLFIE